jgi:hypothetical protein
MLKGIEIGATVIAFTLAVFTLSTMGVYGLAGVTVDSGGLAREDVTEVNEEIGQPEAEAYGTDSPGFFGIATGVTGTMSVLWTMVSGTHTVLQNNGVPWPIAWSVQAMVDLAVGLAIVAIFRGLGVIAS